MTSATVVMLTVVGLAANGQPTKQAHTSYNTVLCVIALLVAAKLGRPRNQ